MHAVEFKQCRAHCESHGCQQLCVLIRGLFLHVGPGFHTWIIWHELASETEPMTKPSWSVRPFVDQMYYLDLVLHSCEHTLNGFQFFHELFGFSSEASLTSIFSFCSKHMNRTSCVWAKVWKQKTVLYKKKERNNTKQGRLRIIRPDKMCTEEAETDSIANNHKT